MYETYTKPKQPIIAAKPFVTAVPNLSIVGSTIAAVPAANAFLMHLK